MDKAIGISKIIEIENKILKLLFKIQLHICVGHVLHFFPFNRLFNNDKVTHAIHKLLGHTIYFW